MWICKRCKQTFSDPDLVWDHGEQYITCPVCMSRDLKRTSICYVCGNPTDYGLCGECKTEIARSFRLWFEEEVKYRHVKGDDLVETITEIFEA